MIATLLMQIDKAKADWARLKKQDASLLNVTQEKLRATWTYHSNALEGNTLTLGETIFFLREGLTSEGKPLKDFVEAKNHAEAIDYLFDVVVNKRDISESLIKELNFLLLKGITETLAKTPSGDKIKKKLNPGQYKTAPNHVLTLSGKIHRYVEPIHVASEIQMALKRYKSQSKKKAHPVLIAADLHYELVRIHPFDDCNGRVARLVMNLILMRHKYPPAVVIVEKRREYLKSLEQADQGDKEAFYQIIADSVLNTLLICAE